MKNDTLIKNFWKWVESIFADSYKQEVKTYLDESSDYADLENRIKLLKVRGLF